jgi:hypothetical protein
LHHRHEASRRHRFNSGNAQNSLISVYTRHTLSPPLPHNDARHAVL